MKTLLTTQYVDIPDGGEFDYECKGSRYSVDSSFFWTHFPFLVTIEVKSRSVTVKGPRGTLHREFKHLNLEMAMVTKNKLRVDAWFAKRKVRKASVNS